MDAPTGDRFSTVKVRFTPDGAPAGATAVAHFDRPAAEVWGALADIERFARRLPMVHRATRRGDEVTFDLRFKLGLIFSVGFQFGARAVQEPGRRVELRWTSGEPRDVMLRFEVFPLDGERACRVETEGAFDVMSLGWLTKYFLRHHAEIQFGIFPGVALVLMDTLRRAVEEG
jgi:carbon monoxide dehydrogenase subunit G